MPYFGLFLLVPGIISARKCRIPNFPQRGKLGFVERDSGKGTTIAGDLESCRKKGATPLFCFPWGSLNSFPSGNAESLNFPQRGKFGFVEREQRQRHGNRLTRQCHILRGRGGNDEREWSLGSSTNLYVPTSELAIRKDWLKSPNRPSKLR